MAPKPQSQVAKAATPKPALQEPPAKRARVAEVEQDADDSDMEDDDLMAGLMNHLGGDAPAMAMGVDDAADDDGENGDLMAGLTAHLGGSAQEATVEEELEGEDEESGEDESEEEEEEYDPFSSEPAAEPPAT